MKLLRREQEDESSQGAPGAPAVRTAPKPPLLPGPSERPTLQFEDFVLAPVAPDRLGALRELLEQVNAETKLQMQGKPVPAPILPFHAIEGLHYARFVLLETSPVETSLAFGADYDGPEGEARCSRHEACAAYVARLEAQPGFERIFSHCRGYRPGQLGAYLRKHRRRASTCYVAAPGRSLRQIRWEAELRRYVDHVLRAERAAKSTPEQVRQHVKQQLEAAWPAGSKLPTFPAQPDLTWKIELAKALAIAAGLALFAGATWPLAALLSSFFGWLGAALAWVSSGVGVLLCVGALLARFRWLELHDPQFQPEFNADTHARTAHAATDENYFLQNQLTHVVEIKPQLLRWLLIRAVFAVLQLLATNLYNKGKLGSIPSIHFARWVLGPGRRVIFFSNFDSSWQSYLGDFIDKASSGLTAVWSNTEQYPRTTWLLEAGSQDASRFLAWTRHYQIPTQVWYSAYPGLSIVNINANTVIRRGLAEPDAVDPVSWLALLRNVDRREVDQRYGEHQLRETPLDLSDIQGIILKGYGHKLEARYLLLAVKQASRALLAWLAQLEITSTLKGARDEAAPDPLVNLAFTYQGLKALGLEASLCDSFATAFVQGACHEDRLRVNGDVGQDAPEHWDWGNDQKPVHVALLVFASSKESVAGHVEKLLHEAEAHGLQQVAVLEATTLPGRKEHFGFRDGIAQPVVKGSGDSDAAENTIAPGEIFLGHRDGYGNVSYAPISEKGFRFGFNGSYMVLRQLEQNVEEFWSYCAEQSGPQFSAVALASKMVGRWPSGAPLVRYPLKDPGGASNENAFGYFETGADNDRYGGRCPFGAHIRRSNPRDWGLGEDAGESIRLSNLHRIMRRGRPYGPAFVASMDAKVLCEEAGRSKAQQAAPVRSARGLQFICFNANLERQFEFVQQQWCKNPKFAGQGGDADPLLGPSALAAQLGVEDPGLTLQSDIHGGETTRLVNLKPFVSLRGSAYLFMPSLSALRLLPCLAETSGVSASELFEKTPADEQLHIDRLIDNIRKLLQDRYTGSQTLRDAHPKMHGCVKAELEVASGLPRELAQGLFAEAGKRYKAWVRFSNQHQDPSPDARRDTRGLALKLFDVPGAKLLDGEESSPCHDFIFLSTPRFVARDVAEFDELIHAVVNKSWGSRLRSLPAMFRHLRSVARHTSPLETTYFGVVPSLLGAQPVKYTVKPRDPQQTPVPQPASRDYLRERLLEQLRQREYLFDVCIQRFVDQKRTPIEDPTVLWRGELEPVAVLRISKQDDFDTPERRELGENLAFNPFRCLPEHRPLGGISRARRQVYRVISKFRHNRNGVVPRDPPPGW